MYISSLNISPAKGRNKQKKVGAGDESIRHLRMKDARREETNVCNFKYISGKF